MRYIIHRLPFVHYVFPLQMPATPYFPRLTNKPIASVLSIHSETRNTNVCKPASLLKWLNSTTLKAGL